MAFQRGDLEFMGLDVRYSVNLDTFIKVLFDDADNRTATRGL